jgi:hypothetical protein
VRKASGSTNAKIWLEPAIGVAESEGFNRTELSAIICLVIENHSSSKRHGMSISATEVKFDEETMWVTLDDGRTLGVPLAWFPRLLLAKPAERNDFELSPGGIHWDALDEDISIAGLLEGRGDRTLKRPAA